MFKSLFYMIILSAVFLLGYHLGRQPNSPDLTSSVGIGCSKAVEAGMSVVNQAQEARESNIAQMPMPDDKFDFETMRTFGPLKAK